MTNKKFLEKTIEDEMPRFERVFKAIPDEPKDLRAHPKNQNTKEIVATLVYDSMSMPIVLETGEFDFGETPPPDLKTVSKAAHIFKNNLEETNRMISKMSDEDWDAPAKLLMNKKVLWETTKGEAVWGTVLDMIHHRGQLSTHIRPQGGTVPSIYGPSGDDEGMM